VGDRDHEDDRSERAPRRVEPETPANMPLPLPGENLGSFLARCERDGLLVKAVPVYVCEFCSDDFNHEPYVPEDMHVEEAKKKGLTFCSAEHLRKAMALLAAAEAL
jgi:hypothetical protein